MNIEKWKLVREKGVKRFVWVTGFLLWGVSTAVLWSIGMQFTHPADPIWVRPLTALVIFPIFGLALGHIVWRLSESKYRELSSQSVT